MNHHAFLFLSEEEDSLQILADYILENLDFKLESSNPDYFRKDVETFGIEESREIKNQHLQKSFKKDGAKVFIVQTKFITNEAQNSLLKILEDPRPDSYFFFILPSSENLLDTLKSRFMLVKNRDEKREVASENLPFEINYFLSLSIPARLKLITKITDSKDKTLALQFLNLLEKALAQKIDLQKISESEILVFETVSKGRSYLNSRSPSVKSVLENILMSVPKM